MTKTIMSYINLYKEKKEEQVGGQFTEGNTFMTSKRKNWQECAITILECGC